MALNQSEGRRWNGDRMKRAIVFALGFGVLLCMDAWLMGVVNASDAARSRYYVDLQKVQFQIVRVLFVTELETETSRFVKDPSKYRGAVVTIKVTKTAGQPVALYSSGINLNYMHGVTPDVARCSGLSTFSTVLPTDRAIEISDSGLIRRLTGPEGTKATEVYIDAFFTGFESDTNEMTLMVVQPASAAFRTDGYEP